MLYIPPELLFAITNKPNLAHLSVESYGRRLIVWTTKLTQPVKQCYATLAELVPN